MASEEDRAFLQDRLAFLGKVAFLLGLALGTSVAVRSTAMRGAIAVPIATDVLYLAMWLGCRRGRLSRPVLGLVDAAFPIVSTTAVALPLLLWPGSIPGLEWAVLLVLTHVQIGRAVFVPSPPLRTMVIGLLAAVPVAAGLWLDQAARAPPAPPGARGAPPRPVHAAGKARRGRHGRGLPGRARHAAPSDRDQAAAAGQGGRAEPGPLRARGAAHRAAQPSEHGLRLRLWPYSGRRLLLRDGVPGGDRPRDAGARVRPAGPRPRREHPAAGGGLAGGGARCRPRAP